MSFPTWSVFPFNFSKQSVIKREDKNNLNINDRDNNIKITENNKKNDSNDDDWGVNKDPGTWFDTDNNDKKKRSNILDEKEQQSDIVMSDESKSDEKYKHSNMHIQYEKFDPRNENSMNDKNDSPNDGNDKKSKSTKTYYIFKAGSQNFQSGSTNIQSQTNNYNNNFHGNKMPTLDKWSQYPAYIHTSYTQLMSAATPNFTIQNAPQ